MFTAKTKTRTDVRFAVHLHIFSTPIFNDTYTNISIISNLFFDHSDYQKNIMNLDKVFIGMFVYHSDPISNS
jgi:hypothetical protein